MGTKAAVRVEDLDTLPPLPEGQDYELSDGEVISAEMEREDRRHERVKSRVARLLFTTPALPGAGEVYIESRFTLGPGTARIPDVAFVSFARLALLGESLRLDVVPEIVVEVISPTDTAMDVERKVDEYLAAGVVEIWNVFTDQRFVRVRTKDGIRDLDTSATLTTPVLPGFSTCVADFFAD